MKRIDGRVPDGRASIFVKNRISGTYLKNKFQELEEFKIEALRGEVLNEPDRLVSEPANYRRAKSRHLIRFLHSHKLPSGSFFCGNFYFLLQKF